MLRGQFETATNGTYSWLNDVAAIGVLTRNGTTSVLIDMWQASICLIECKEHSKGMLMSDRLHPGHDLQILEVIWKVSH